MKWWARAAAALLLGGAGCDMPREPAGPIARETFIEVMASLRRAADETGDSALFAARKAEILRAAGVTEAELRAYARLEPLEPRDLADIYDSVAARLQRYQEPE